MKLRLMNGLGYLAHEFDIDQDTDGDTVLVHEGKHYVYRDAGGDDEDGWEEWQEATLVELNVLVGPR